MSTFVQSKRLPSGNSIPSVALGVFQSNAGSEAYNAVLTALKLGYRHIDTATAYENESDVGRAIRDSGIPREEIFVTSKYYEISWIPWSTTTKQPWTYQGVVDGVQESNRKLGLGYIDLYLLHAPCDGATRAEAWRALEDLQAEGIVRDIGVSNFGEQHLLKLAKTWRVKPAVNQVELHPWCGRAETVKFCEEQGILMEAYSPLARAQKMDDPVVVEIANELNATQAQVMIAWSLAKGFIPLPKSVKEERIKSNLQAAELKLSVEQVAKLDNLDEYFWFGWDPIKQHDV
ncbi:putative oxidoreductase C2F3.05c [Phytophthora citrophthora]|uniref:Oxidoreductase C2F3.05c n=1 Tax=Phytophthora citrophthora TaxID=4793 RepID=A0AAD9LQX1_9STRA|nr:putative oxidoreductase C2F3.05c [Phytophthora citrophthora]